jgi:tRNA(Ile)-lysidine synthase
MLKILLEYIEKEKLFYPDERILLAVSGGLDSSVMAELFHQAGFSFGMAHCNFQLRGEESSRDEKFVRDLAVKYRVPLHVRLFETASYARKNKLSIQMAARKLRYDWFEELLDKEGYAYLATAHHLDDQIETFLINLARGTGIAGLHGILPKQGRIIRPMLFASRQDLLNLARETNLQFVEDSSNLSLKYTRNRIRHKIIPQFEKINPSFREEMAVTIQKLKEAETVYRSIINKEKERLLIPYDQGYKLSVSELKKLVPGRTWLYELLSDFGFSSSVVEDVIASLDDQPGKVFHSPTHRLVKDREFLLITLHPVTVPMNSFEAYPEMASGFPIKLSFNLRKRKPFKMPSDETIAMIDYDKLHLPISIRKWKTGDYFYPLGMSNRKKISDFFVDQKFSILQKESTWLLCSGNDIVWIIGERLDDRFKINSETKTVLQVRLFL